MNQQADQQGMQDVLTEDLAEYSVEQQETKDMKLVKGHWRKKQEILPLMPKEEKSEPQKLEIKPLPVELKYDYLEEQE